MAETIKITMTTHQPITLWQQSVFEKYTSWGWTNLCGMYQYNTAVEETHSLSHQFS